MSTEPRQGQGGVLEALVAACLRWRAVVLAAVLLIAALGVRAASSLPIDAVPDITNTQVQVLTSAPAASPLDVERQITGPVEAALSGLPDVEELRSLSRPGLSAVTIVFREGTDLLRARQLVAERLATARDALPQGVEPQLGPLATGLSEIFQFEVKADAMCAPDAPDTPQCWTPMELRELLDWFLVFELRNVAGVVEVNAFGGELKTFEVEADVERLRARDVTLAQLYEALERNNLAAGGGNIVRDGEQVLVRGDARISGLEELAQITIRTSADGTPIQVQDVGQVKLAPALRHGAVSRDGRGEAVIGIVLMQVGANGRQVVERVRERLDEIKPGLPAGVTVDVFYDRAELVERTIHTVAKNLIEGALCVIGVLFLLLGTLRGGLIVACAIPFSLLVAFLGMKQLGLSGNLMSLGAMDFGIVVDGSIIVVESAMVHLAAAMRGHDKPLTYEQAARVVLKSAVEVRKAAMFGEAIIVLVYVPLLLLQGVEGKMFKPMALTVLFALGGAFIASLTLVPVLVATFLRHKTDHSEPWLVRLLERGYKPLLDHALHSPRLIITLSLLAVLGAGWIASGQGAEFVPRLDEGAVAINVTRLPSVTLEESVAGAGRMERALLKMPEVETVVSKTGRAELAMDPMGVEMSDVHVQLKPRDTWEPGLTKEALVAHMQRQLNEAAPGMNAAFSQPIELRMAELLSGSKASVAITLYGEDLAELERLSTLIQASIREVSGAADVRGEPLTGLPTLEIRPLHAQASRYGVDAQEIMDAVAAIGGREVGVIYEGQRRFTLQVRLPRVLRTDVERLSMIPVGEARVPLAQVATVSLTDSPAVINHEGTRRRTLIEANVRERDLASFVEEARAKVRAEVKLPPGYVARWGGQLEQLEAASQRLTIMLPLVLGLIIVLLYLAFGAWRPVALIALNIPLAAVGGVLALWARGLPLSISAAVGFIALCGVAVLNGVVLLSTTLKLHAQLGDAMEAARQGAQRRMRAVVMTALVAALGFLPMALSSSAGAEVQRPLASVVIGGLLTSTLLTLFVLPSLYARFVRTPEGADEAPADVA